MTNAAAPSPLREDERYVTVEDGLRVWTQSHGGGAIDERPALLILHGGPGVPHDYLNNLAALASPRQRVVFYDQLGCGRSDCPDEPQRWRLPRFVAEIGYVRRALGLEGLVLLGQSWGGMLALEYALSRPSGLTGMILANSLASASLFEKEVLRLRSLLPSAVQATLARHEADGTTDSADYRSAMNVFYGRHVVRVQPIPDFVQHSFDHIGQPYAVMWGPSELHVTGNLKGWDCSSRLGEIGLPVLLISGEHDESTPLVNQSMKDGIPGAQWVLLEGCSHLSHVEAPERFGQAVRDFLARL